MKRFLIGLGTTVLAYAGTAVPALANPADAPANQIGTTVADLAQTVSPNFGQAVCAPAGQTQTEDDGVLLFLGLTPPGNTP
jgi:hypothetical protein